VAPEAKPAKKVSAARSKAKAERAAPEKVPGRKERRGIVVSDAMDKTIVVRIDVAQKHERYGKVVRRSSKLHAHDEQNAAGVGDLVRVVETRPLSATKRWRLLEVLEKAK
jgi:small subunit ribosomal protein S17